VILIAQYPVVGRPSRQAEFDFCLRENLANKYIDRVVLLQEPHTGAITHPKIDISYISGRMTYYDAAIAADEFIDEICIIANADIRFDETLGLLKREDFQERTAFCLSRQDMVEKQFEGAPAGRVSQDAWIFMAPIHGSEEFNLKFELGRPGCDNRFAHELSKAYRLRNPSLTIKCWHHHGGPRAGTFVEGAGPIDEPGNMERDRILGPYAFVPVEAL
jgi:hypothetical protein